MPFYRVTMYMGQAQQGWSESHYSRESWSPSMMTDKVSDLMADRVGIMFTNQRFDGVRIVDLGNDPAMNPQRGLSIAFKPGSWPYPGSNDYVEVPSTGNMSITPVTRRPDQIRAALQMRMMYEGPRKSIQYLAGIPDAVSDTEPATYSPTGDEDWRKALSAYIEELTTFWGLKARQVPPTAPKMTPSGYVQQQAAPGLLGVVVSATDYPVYTTRDMLYITGSKWKTKQQKTLNGKYYVNSVNTTLIPGSVVYFLEGTEGSDPSQIKIRGKVQVVRYSIYPYLSVTPQAVGIHKRGLPSLAFRGRRSTYESLDP